MTAARAVGEKSGPAAYAEAEGSGLTARRPEFEERPE